MEAISIFSRIFACLMLLSATWCSPTAWAQSAPTTIEQKREFDDALAAYTRYAGRDNFDALSFFRMQKAAERENPLALAWLRTEAESNAAAAVSLGKYYGSKGDGNSAVAQFQRAAKQGSADALSWLANLYGGGWWGVSKNPKISCEWRKKSAEAGDYNGAVEYGVCVARAVGGIRPDLNEACRWGEIGADGYAKSVSETKKEVPPNEFDGPDWKGFKQLAARAYALFAICLQDNPDAKSRIGEAATWYKRSAELGFAYSAFAYGDLLEQGWGVVQNYAEAVRWYRTAAEDGYSEAQNRLGAKYAEGKGIKKNMVDALKWFIIAAANGEDKAIVNRDKAEKSLSPADLKKAQAMAAEWMKKNRPQ